MEQQKINNALYFPMLVSENGNIERMTPDFSAEIWEKFHALPQEKQDILVSKELPYKIKDLQDAFHLDDKAIGHVTLMVRKIFFGELAMAEVEAKIGSMLATTNGGDPNQAKTIVEFIQKEIIELKPKPRAEEAEEEERLPAATVNMPLLQALSKYEGLGNQLITQERIKVKSQPEPVRPSLLYWLKYYRDDIGVGHHDSVQRGQFLFRSENGKKLSAEERERLGFILKSVEENFPLAIDTEHQEIIFPTFQGVMIGNRKEPAAIPANARIIRGPVFGGTAEEGERMEKKFTPANLNPYESGGLRIGRGTHFGNLEQPAAPAEPGAVSFSASHMFPAEKEAAEHTAAASQAEMRQASQPAPQPAPRPVVAPGPKPNPFHIHPVSLGKKDSRNQE